MRLPCRNGKTPARKVLQDGTSLLVLFVSFGRVVKEVPYEALVVVSPIDFICGPNLVKLNKLILRGNTNSSGAQLIIFDDFHPPSRSLSQY